MDQNYVHIWQVHWEHMENPSVWAGLGCGSVEVITAAKRVHWRITVLQKAGNKINHNRISHGGKGIGDEVKLYSHMEN